MAILILRDICIAFGGQKVLESINLQIEKGQRICLLGRNGSGKSTLMKIISGRITADSGELHKETATKISYFSQEIPRDLQGTVFEITAAGLGLRGELLLKHHTLEKEALQETAIEPDVHTRLNEQMDLHNVWPAVDEIKKIHSRMNLNADWEYQALSGGQKRRVLLAAALVSQPEILLLDEPTNHLDIETISWLEEFLLRSGVTLLFVTHDRSLLKRLADRIIELDRGRLTDWSCDYETFLQRKQAVLDAEEKEWENFDKKLAREEQWIRKGIRARRTRNEGRVRALEKMREERKQRRTQEGTAILPAAEAGKSGKLVLEAKSAYYSYDAKPLIADFSCTIRRGDKIGIIGPNGCGKTTLVNLLLGRIQPQKGRIRFGTNLETLYFDQMREQLDEHKSVWENVLPNGNMVSVNGKNVHIITYLKDFLFTPERAASPVSQLSGGERSRLLLARLFTREANFLILDEPTNDLDTETLELLEELLARFKGTVILVSHDRTFLNNVVTSIFAFSENGMVNEFIGGYDDWLRQRKTSEPALPAASKIDKKKTYKEEKKAKRRKKRSFKEEQEYKALPEQIESLEEEQKAIFKKMSDPGFYRDREEASALSARLKTIEAELTATYERWEYLGAIE